MSCRHRVAELRRRSLAWVLLLILAGTPGAAMHLQAQQDVAALPRNYQVVFENALVQVIHVHYAPHEKVPMHDHSADPTVYVYLSDSGPVRFTHTESRAEGGAGVLTRPPIRAGAFRVSPGRRERHSVENLGEIASDFLRVELKGMSFGTLPPFRGEAPADLSRSAISVAVKIPEIEIDRIVCAGSDACPLPSLSAPSLLVAFTAAEITSGKNRALAAGQVAWMNAGQSATVRASAHTPAHLLRMILPASPHS